jgi:hypothetical protein
MVVPSVSQWFHQSLCSCFQNHVLFAGSAGKLRKNGLCGTVASQVADLACAISENNVFQWVVAIKDVVFCMFWAPEFVVLSCSW